MPFLDIPTLEPRRLHTQYISNGRKSIFSGTTADATIPLLIVKVVHQLMVLSLENTFFSLCSYPIKLYPVSSDTLCTTVLSADFEGTALAEGSSSVASAIKIAGCSFPHPFPLVMSQALLTLCPGPIDFQVHVYSFFHRFRM